MRKRTLRRVNFLEKAEGSRQLEQHSSLATSFFFCRKVVLAYYLGGLKPDDQDPGEAEARALNYESRNDYLEALLKGEKAEIRHRVKNAARRLFAQVEFDFDRSPPPVLFDTFVSMVNQLPEQWLKWLTSNLQASRSTESNMLLRHLNLQPTSRSAVNPRTSQEHDKTLA